MRYILGLDLGITSIGWAIYDIDKQTIDRCGVRLFDAAENPKDKSSLALPRRDARGQRRRLRRRAYRMQSIKNLLTHEKLLTDEQISTLFHSQGKTLSSKSLYDVYELRYQALNSLLTNQQLSQILIHLAKHRGFKSNRKKDKSLDGAVNNSLENNKKTFTDGNYRTIGEMLYLDSEYKANRRNRFGEYRVMLQRSDIEAEAKIILSAQKTLGNKLITDKFIEQYIKIFNWQKLFDWRDDIIKMVGSCQFEKEEKRAPKACFSSEKFVALSKLNNILIKDTKELTERKLSSGEIQQVINFVLAKTAKSSPKITFANLRNELGLSDNERFNFVKYKSSEDFYEQEKNEQIRELSFSATHELKYSIINSLGEITWSKLLTNQHLLDKLAVNLTYSKTDDKIRDSLQATLTQYANNFTNAEQQQIINIIVDTGIGFDKNISLSLNVLYKIIPYLEIGLRYDEACKEAGYNHSAIDNNKHFKLPSIQSIGLDQELTNPVVTRAISQTRKVINAIIDKYGSPYQINIELARDVGKSAKQRNEISRKQKSNKDVTDKLRDSFIEHFNRNPIKDELTKYRLWKQQSGKCVYSGESINLYNLQHGTNLTQIDHIIPHSRCFDDSITNKVLCLTSENQRKGNQTPFEYIGANGHDPEAWHEFSERCGQMNKTGFQQGFTYNKLNRLLLKKFDQEGFIERNLNDTRYIAKFMLNYLQNYLQFADSNHKKPVRALTGQATAFIRNHWGFSKIREESDKHHAQDACVIAATTTSTVNKITQYMQAKSYGKDINGTCVDPESGEIFDNFPMPHINFRAEIISKVNDVFVSRMPRHKTTGKVHDDTIRSRKYMDNPIAEYNDGKPFSTINKPLVGGGIKLDKNGEVANLCPTYKQHNPNIYRLLVERLQANDNDAKKAFAEPLYAPRKDGTPSETQIKTVKIIQAQNTGVRVNEGIADNGGMVRIDIFHKDGKNYIVPIYLVDTIRDTLPNRAIVQSKPENEWQLIDESFTFMYSFYSNDLIKIITKKETYFGYYVGCHRGTAALSIKKHDGSCEYNSLGVKVNAIIEKYQVDVLGNYVKVNRETRLDFTKK